MEIRVRSGDMSGGANTTRDGFQTGVGNRKRGAKKGIGDRKSGIRASVGGKTTTITGNGPIQKGS